MWLVLRPCTLSLGVDATQGRETHGQVFQFCGWFRGIPGQLARARVQRVLLSVVGQVNRHHACTTTGRGHALSTWVPRVGATAGNLQGAHVTTTMPS